MSGLTNCLKETPMSTEKKNLEPGLPPLLPETKTVMDTFVNIAKKASDANSTSYGSGGKYSKIDNTRSAMAINQTL